MKAEVTSEKRASAAAEVNENEPAQKLARKLVRKGGIEFRNRSLEMPAGPKNLEDLMAWPAFTVGEVVADPERKMRLFDVMRKGLSVTTAYSGLDAPREVLLQVSHVLREKYNLWPQIDFIHACDIAPGPQAVLRQLARNLDLNASCVFGDLEDRLPLETKNFLASLAPSRTASNSEKACAYKEMWEHLHSHRQAVFNPFATSACAVHGTQCRVVGTQVSLDPDSQDTQDMSPGLSGLVRPRPLNVHFAGSVCKGWSLAGGREQFSHESERTHGVWLSERKARAEQCLEDIFFQECTPAYPVDEKLKDPLEETHTVVAIKTGPELQGWPTTRPRSFTAALNNRRWVWVGPATDTAIQQEFDTLFGRSCEMTGDAFFVAPEKMIRDDVGSRLHKRGQNTDLGPNFAVNMELLYSMLPPGACQRLAQYEMMRAEKQSIEDGCFICDVNQWPSSGCSGAGPFFPCQLTHQTCVSFNHMRPAVGLEFLLAQGFHVFPEAHGGKPAAVLPILKEWKTDKVVALSGNSMSLPAIAAWVVYVLSNIEPFQAMPIQPETSMLMKGASTDFSSPVLCRGSSADAADTVADSQDSDKERAQPLSQILSTVPAVSQTLQVPQSWEWCFGPDGPDDEELAESQQSP